MFLVILDGNFDVPDGCMFRISRASKKTEKHSEDESNKTSSNQGEEDEAKLSLLACEQALQFGRAKQASRKRSIEGRSREGQRISHKFSFPPRKPRDSAKRVYLFVEGRGSRVPCRGRGYHVEGRG